MAVDITNHLIPWAIAKRMQADAWDEGYEAGNYDTREFDAVTECRVDYDDYEDTPNPYRDTPLRRTPWFGSPPRSSAQSTK